MAYNGVGVFQRLFNWVNDRDASIDITASRMDAEMDGFATGLTNCVTKDGQTNPTANLPMNSNKHTGVAASSSRTDYADTGGVQDGGFTYVADSGAADAYVLTLSPAITAYTAGQRFVFKATNANTGASTINVNSVGVKDLKDKDGAALAANAILANGMYDILYDGTEFRLQGSIAANSITLAQMAQVATDRFLGRTTAGTGNVEALTAAQAQAILGAISSSWTNQQYIGRATLTDGATINWNLDTESMAKVTLAGNRTVAAPTNQNDGGVYSLRIIQDATGSRTLTWNSVYKFGDAGEPTLSTAANAIDIITFESDGTNMAMVGFVSGVQS